LGRNGPVAAFCNELGLRASCRDPFGCFGAMPTTVLPTWILALVYAIMAGLRRFNKTEILQYKGTFLSLLGLSRFPDQSALRRLLKGMSPRSVRQLVALHDQLRAQLFPLLRRRTTLTFDLDSVVLTVDGKQQFAQVATIPRNGAGVPTIRSF